jgi:lysophospholipase L1-like esterase
MYRKQGNRKAIDAKGDAAGMCEVPAPERATPSRSSCGSRSTSGAQRLVALYKQHGYFSHVDLRMLSFNDACTHSLRRILFPPT